MTFETRYAKLNKSQQHAVDTIDGPLLVIAGPGTGKTELLSMRTAAILKKTDTLPSNILCLTFTESGATAMRERLKTIIGADAYKIAIHTFHSFGTEIINQNAEFFFRGAQFQPADELAQYEIMRSIFDEMNYTNPLASMNGDEYIYLRDASSVISELKRSGLTSEELRQVLDANDAVLDEIERDIATVFAGRISKTTVHALAPIAQKVAAIPEPQLPPAITPYANTLALSIAHAVDEAAETDSTKPITAWKNAWCEKNEHGDTVLKDRGRHNKLRALAHVYYQYLTRMQEAGLFDYDDMILEVIHTMEARPELRANLQEKFQYILVDEFQDTNLAQLRLLFDITSGVEQPNVMAVGDDDQAIYSFQGADIGNIQRFRSQYGDPEIIVLTDNYRSTPAVLTTARSVIVQGADRLENTIEDLNKTLTPHVKTKNIPVELHEYISHDDERRNVAEQIKQKIDSGISPDSIAILARRHTELVSLLPYLANAGVSVNYERRENVLDHEIIRLLEHLCLIIDALHRDAHDEADAYLPEILAHPAWGYNPSDIYKLSLASYRNHQLWLEAMQTQPVFKPFADWLIIRAAAIHVEPLEVQIDSLLGINQSGASKHRADTFSERHLQPESESASNHSQKALSSRQSLAKTEEVSGQARLMGVIAGGEDESGRAMGSEADTPMPNDASGNREWSIAADGGTDTVYTSPLYNYFFSTEKLAKEPDAYLSTLEALRTIRDQLREHYGHTAPTIQTFIEFLAMHRELGSSVTAVRRRGEGQRDKINMMTAHKSKGLEFDHVFIIGATDNAWGERVRARSRLISYPANLPLAPTGDTLDERLRLFFVAMTRAKATLSISYSAQDSNEKSTLVASFLSGIELEPQLHEATSDIATLTEQAEIDWRSRLVSSADVSSLRELLAPTLENYKLSATHLGNFLDLSQGGPHHFLLNNLLRFPQAKSAHANYGTAIHATLQRAHDFYRAMGQKRPLEDVLGDYEKILRDQHLSEQDFDTFYNRGIDSLSAFLTSNYDSFQPTQRTEVGFGNQGVMIGDARLTGALDLVDIHDEAKTIHVTDYKTGKPSRDWKGKTEYEKIKLHKYRQQLMFYQLLCENSRDYSKFAFDGGTLQFVEPTPSGDSIALEDSFSDDDLARFKQLINAVWQRIMTLDFPDISHYGQTLKDIEKFEQDIIDNNSVN